MPMIALSSVGFPEIQGANVFRSGANIGMTVCMRAIASILLDCLLHSANITTPRSWSQTIRAQPLPNILGAAHFSILTICLKAGLDFISSKKLFSPKFWV